MIEGITLQDKSLIAEMTAKALLEVQAAHAVLTESLGSDHPRTQAAQKTLGELGAG